jgi:hypothetical protein
MFQTKWRARVFLAVSPFSCQSSSCHLPLVCSFPVAATLILEAAMTNLLTKSTTGVAKT